MVCEKPMQSVGFSQMLPWLLLCFAAWMMLVASSVQSPTSYPKASNAELLRYLQNEQAAVTSAQQRIKDFLHSKRISIGSDPVDPTKIKNVDDDSIHHRLAVSTEDHPIECRITLDAAPPGAICVAPCGCSGSQKWVQFSVLNKLRRKEPQQWVTCQTCRQPFRFDLIAAHAGLKANLLATVLDNMNILRIALLALIGAVAYLLSVPAMVQSFLVSRTLWQAVSTVNLHDFASDFPMLVSALVQAGAHSAGAEDLGRAHAAGGSGRAVPAAGEDAARGPLGLL